MVKKIHLNKLEHIIRKYWIVLFILGTAVYFISCVAVNFVTGKTWYNPDMYSDAFVAELMADNMTFFPDNWTFGNQYYIVATPVLGAIFYKIIGNGFYAMAFASSIMTFFVYVSYLWCLKPFVSRKICVAGLFVLSGGIVFGTGASDYICGFQLLYTMASYYSCYIIGVFLTLGLFLRIYHNISYNKIWFVITGLINFALGMQSLREMLIFNLPLVTVTLYLMIIHKNNRKREVIFSSGMALCNLLGIIFMKVLVRILFIDTHQVISEVAFRTDISLLEDGLKNELHNLFTITGLCFQAYMKADKIFVFLFIGALLFILCVIISLIAIFIKKDTSPLAITILCCFVSIVAVFLVGIFFFYNRPIYYFVWYLLGALSTCYVLTLFKKKYVIKSLFMIMILFVGMINYYTNFYTEFVKHSDRENFYRELTQEFIDDDIQYVYLCGIWNTDCSIYCYANDTIKIGVVNFDREHLLLKPFPALKSDDIFKKENLKNAYIIFTDNEIGYMEGGHKEEFQQFLSTLDFVREKHGEGKIYRTIKVYKAKGDIFYRGNE